MFARVHDHQPRASRSLPLGTMFCGYALVLLCLFSLPCLSYDIDGYYREVLGLRDNERLYLPKGLLTVPKLLDRGINIAQQSRLDLESNVGKFSWGNCKPYRGTNVTQGLYLQLKRVTNCFNRLKIRYVATLSTLLGILRNGRLGIDNINNDLFLPQRVQVHEGFADILLKDYGLIIWNSETVRVPFIICEAGDLSLPVTTVTPPGYSPRRYVTFTKISRSAVGPDGTLADLFRGTRTAKLGGIEIGVPSKEMSFKLMIQAYGDNWRNYAPIPKNLNIINTFAPKPAQVPFHWPYKAELEKYDLLSSHAQLPSTKVEAFNFTRKLDDVYLAVSRIVNELARENVQAILYAGSVIGGRRHHGHIPLIWEKDVDLAVFSLNYAKIETALGRVEKLDGRLRWRPNDSFGYHIDTPFEMYIDLWLYSPIRNKKNGSMFVTCIGRINPGNGCGTWWNERRGLSHAPIYPYDMFLPPTRIPFGPFLMPAIKRSEAYMTTRYGTGVFSMCGFPNSMPCYLYYDEYPFTFFTELGPDEQFSESRRREELKIGSATIHTFEVFHLDKYNMGKTVPGTGTSEDGEIWKYVQTKQKKRRYDIAGLE